MWIPTSRVCGCCKEENLFAKLLQPSKPDNFGKRLYTYVCRKCDLSEAPGFWGELNAGFRQPPPTPAP